MVRKAILYLGPVEAAVAVFYPRTILLRFLLPLGKPTLLSLVQVVQVVRLVGRTTGLLVRTHNLHQSLPRAEGMVRVSSQQTEVMAGLVAGVQVMYLNLRTKAALETRHLEARHKEIKVVILGRILEITVVLAVVERLLLVATERLLLVATVAQDLLALLAGQVWPMVAVVAQAVTVLGEPLALVGQV